MRADTSPVTGSFGKGTTWRASAPVIRQQGSETVSHQTRESNESDSDELAKIQGLFVPLLSGEPVNGFESKPDTAQPKAA